MRSTLLEQFTKFILLFEKFTNFLNRPLTRMEQPQVSQNISKIHNIYAAHAEANQKSDQRIPLLYVYLSRRLKLMIDVKCYAYIFAVGGIHTLSANLRLQKLSLSKRTDPRQISQ